MQKWHSRVIRLLFSGTPFQWTGPQSYQLIKSVKSSSQLTGKSSYLFIFRSSCGTINTISCFGMILCAVCNQKVTKHTTTRERYQRANIHFPFQNGSQLPTFTFKMFPNYTHFLFKMVSICLTFLFQNGSKLPNFSFQNGSQLPNFYFQNGS